MTVKGVHPVHTIRVYSVNRAGRPSATAVTTTSSSTLPFGFTFDRNGHLLVAEPFGNQFTGTPAPGLSAASSYTVAGDGTLTQVSAR